jgi:hypothetical protein
MLPLQSSLFWSGSYGHLHNELPSRLGVRNSQKKKRSRRLSSGTSSQQHSRSLRECAARAAFKDVNLLEQHQAWLRRVSQVGDRECTKFYLATVAGYSYIRM